MNKRLKAAIRRRGSQRSFAALLGVTETALGFWLSGKRRPSREHAMRIKRLTGVNLLNGG